MNCPVCSDAELLLGDRQGVEIDYCPSCRGVWLDRGELDKIAERSSGMSAAPTGVQGAHDDDRCDDRHDSDRDHDGSGGRDGSRKKKKKKGGFLGDILGGLGGD